MTDGVCDVCRYVNGTHWSYCPKAESADVARRPFLNADREWVYPTEDFDTVAQSGAWQLGDE